MTTTKAGRYFLLAGCLMLTFSGLFGQTKYYATVGYGSIYYHNKANGGMPTLSNVYYGLEVDHYLDYHYAFTTGAFFLQGGYDNKASRMVNKFIQVPVGIKMASLGDQLGISAGLNFNYLLSSQLTELADTLNNYYSVDITPALKKIQPDFYFGLLYRLNRVTAQFKMSFALTNRYSTAVKPITDKVQTYYGSFYVYELGKEEKKLTAWTTLITLSVRLF